MWNYDYDDRILETFRGNSNLSIALTLGLLEEAFELRLFSASKFTLDLFLMYKFNKTYQWNGYQIKRHLFM